MTYFPDFRKEESKLTGERKAILKGFDIAYETLETAFNNMDAMAEDSLIAHYLEKHEDEKNELLKAIEYYFESTRNELGASLLDEEANEDETEKEEVDVCN